MTAASAAVVAPAAQAPWPAVDDHDLSFADLVDDESGSPSLSEEGSVSLPAEVVASEPVNDLGGPPLSEEPFIEEPLPTIERLRARGTKTVSGDHLRKDEALAGRLTIYPDVERPTVRGDCAGGERPCPWVSCRWHLYLDVAPNGSLKVNFPERDPWELEETCALDVADRGGETLERVGELVDVTRERIRQVELKALARAQRRNPEAGEYLDESKQTTGLGQSPWMAGEGE